jgi:NAD(P)-dependent dehydrogenase (short-subunit alcohol dehydrogenase family)
MQELRGRTAVVVGGGSGVGRGVALGLGGEGMQVVVADIDPKTAEAVRAEIVGAGGQATAAAVDGTDRSALADLAAHARSEHGAVHVLSTNVGVFANQPLDTATEQDWAWIVEFNLLSAVRAVEAFLPHLRRAAGSAGSDGSGGSDGSAGSGGSAHIVITASMAALMAPGAGTHGVHLGLYTATKHALLGYGETLRGELAHDGIGVSVLCPGMVRSNLAATSARNRPARYGGPLPEPDGAPLPQSMAPEAVGPVVVRGIKANRLHILTHPESRQVVEARHAVLIDDFSFFSES